LETLKLLEGQAMQHRIGDAARLSGVPAANIRYYEKEGLLAAQARADNRYRLYSDDEVHRLRFVRLCRAMDMSLDEVRTLLALDAGGTADGHAACATLDEHLGHVRTRLAELHALEQELRALRGHGRAVPRDRGAARTRRRRARAAARAAGAAPCVIALLFD
jgi:DNA-binding transcriptional MerR regulator